MANILFHPEAQADYDLALIRYQSQSRQTAARFEAEVNRVLGLISSSPEMYPEYDDTHRFAVLRKYPYSIIYKVQSGQVLVVAVAHSSRPPYWQGRV